MCLFVAEDLAHMWVCDYGRNTDDREREFPVFTFKYAIFKNQTFLETNIKHVKLKASQGITFIIDLHEQMLQQVQFLLMQGGDNNRTE